MSDHVDRPPPMSKPAETDGVICPGTYDKTEILTPEKVYEVKGHDGKTVRRGILGKHQHRMPTPYGYGTTGDCDYEGHPVIVTPQKPTAKKE